MNPPYSYKKLQDAVKCAERRKMKTLFCGPSDENRKSQFWYEMCMNNCNGIYIIFNSAHNPKFADIFLPESTNYQHWNQAPNFDVIVFWLDFTNK